MEDVITEIEVIESDVRDVEKVNCVLFMMQL